LRLCFIGDRVTGGLSALVSQECGSKPAIIIIISVGEKDGERGKNARPAICVLLLPPVVVVVVAVAQTASRRSL